MSPEGLSHSGAGPLAGTGLSGCGPVHANLMPAQLIAHAIRRNEGRLSTDGALIVRTGTHTGRSAQDKFVADEPDSNGDVWWGKVNQKLAPEKFAALKSRVQAYLDHKELFTQDLYAGTDPATRLRIRVVTTGAWQALFARTVLLRPEVHELRGFQPDFVLLHAPEFHADPAIDGVRGPTAIALSFGQRTIVIAGTQYAGEIKKSVFTVMNWLLPQRGVLPMHCSANIGEDGDVALFFGLSGTGKTTLSCDGARRLIGDDEHGWGADGVFNIEGGCYAKVIRLSETAEPQIWRAVHRFGTVLENVVADACGRLDLDDATYTENTRACYPIDFLPNVEPSGRGGHPRHIVMLTADAFGVLPPIARLSPAQALYHFLAGYTARIAGTEKGVGSEPQATFSTCFGAPFLPRRPEVYGRMLEEMIGLHGAECWLVNTGWAGGPHGVGKRMAIADTRALLDAALHGGLARVRFEREPFFGLMIPESAPGVAPELLDPRRSWRDKAAYDRAAAQVAARFEQNFAAFAEQVGDEVKAVAIRSPVTAK